MGGPPHTFFLANTERKGVDANVISMKKENHGERNEQSHLHH